mmetsp:Transcript_16998/g.45851  ORF Transcript_16998/g.45851 Transcript_16998/m.45851 type:complete len:240 (+) Transcript_16998:634-1353(+)
MRRGAVLKCREQEAKLRLGLLLCEAEERKEFGLHGAVVNSDGPTADLDAIDDHVVGIRAHLARVRVHEWCILRLAGGEGMMHSHVALVVLIPLEEREVHHPEGGEALVTEAQVRAHEVAELAQRCLRLQLGPPENADEVALRSLACIRPLLKVLGAKELLGRRVQVHGALLKALHLHPHEARCAHLLARARLLEVLHLLGGPVANAWAADCAHVLRLIEHLEVLALSQVRDLTQLHAKA